MLSVRVDDAMQTLHRVQSHDTLTNATGAIFHSLNQVRIENRKLPKSRGINEGILTYNSSDFLWLRAQVSTNDLLYRCICLGTNVIDDLCSG